MYFYLLTLVCLEQKTDLGGWFFLDRDKNIGVLF